MKQDGLTIHDLQLVQQALENFPNVKKAILFGSRAKGTHKPGSDVDLAIQLSDNCDHASTIRQIHETLEESIPLPYFFDVIDFHSIENQALIEHIERVGIEIYST